MPDKKKILIVDDDVAFCELTQEMMTQIGYHAVSASDTKEALRVFSETPHQFDLIVLDYMLSGTYGTELAAEFLRVRPEIPIALYTGAVVPVEEVRSKGIHAVINKPLTKSELAAAIRHILGDVL